MALRGRARRSRATTRRGAPHSRSRRRGGRVLHGLTDSEAASRLGRMVSASEWTRLLEPSSLSLPRKPRVVDIIARPYVDHLGDEELLVYVVLDDRSPEAELTWPRLRPIYDRIHARVRSLDDAPYPYVEFRRRSELEDSAS